LNSKNFVGSIIVNIYSMPLRPYDLSKFFSYIWVGLYGSFSGLSTTISN